MKRWPTKLLGEVCDVEGGNAAPQGDEHFKDGTIPFVRMKDLGRYHFTGNLCDTYDKLSEASAAANRMKFFEPGCILFPRSGSVALNHRAILGVRACVVSHIGLLQNFRPEITPGFLYRYLTTFDMTALSKKTTGVDSIAFADVKRIPIPVPPLREQERIVKLLDEADELRKLRAEADGRTADLIPALFHEMFGDPTHLEKMRWQFKPLAEFAAVSYGLADKLDASTRPEEGTRILTISNVLQNGAIDIKVEKYSVVGRDKRVKARLEKFDLLFNWRNGSEEHVGKTAIWEEQVEGEILHVSFLLKIRVDQSQANPYFLWALLNRLRATGYFTRNARMQVNRKFNASELSALDLPLPPLNLQKEFAARVSEIRATVTEQTASRRRLDDLFQSMLHRAFQGEL